MREQSPISARKWVILFALFAMIVTSIPYGVGFLNQGEKWRFTGFLFGVEDGNSYLAKMLTGTSGEWLFRSPYYALDQDGVIAFFPYLLLGKLAILPIDVHFQLMILFHIFRILSGMAMIVATYDFIAIYLEKEIWRRWALVMICFGGGLGWVLIFFNRAKWFGSLPLEFVSPESFGFLALYGLPHLACARALLLWGLRAFVLKRSILYTALFWFLMAFFQPLNVFLGWAVSGFYVMVNLLTAIRGKVKANVTDWYYLTYVLRRYAVILILTSPLVLYTTITFHKDTYLRAWTAQNRITSPHPVHYLLAYGLVIIFLVPGFKRMQWEYPRKSWLLLGWIILFPFLISLPIVVQRRLAEGIWVVMIISAVKSFESKVQPLSGRWAYLGVLLIPSTAVLFYGGIQIAQHPSLPAFRPEREVSTFTYIKENIDRNSIFMTSHGTGNGLPAWAPVHVVLGHSPETAPFRETKDAVRTFYSHNLNDGERMQLLDEYQVDYVYWGPFEQRIGDWKPDPPPFLSLEYQNGPYHLYLVDVE